VGDKGNLAGVRVFSDDVADRAARQLDTDAFALDRNVYFRKGKFDPTRPEGAKLLAHELTHALAPRSFIRLGNGSDAIPGEAEAREAGEAAEEASKKSKENWFKRAGKKEEFEWGEEGKGWSGKYKGYLFGYVPESLDVKHGNKFELDLGYKGLKTTFNKGGKVEVGANLDKFKDFDLILKHKKVMFKGEIDDFKPEKFKLTTSFPMEDKSMLSFGYVNPSRELWSEWKAKDRSVRLSGVFWGPDQKVGGAWKYKTWSGDVTLRDYELGKASIGLKKKTEKAGTFGARYDTETKEGLFTWGGNFDIGKFSAETKVPFETPSALTAKLNYGYTWGADVRGLPGLFKSYETLGTGMKALPDAWDAAGDLKGKVDALNENVVKHAKDVMKRTKDVKKKTKDKDWGVALDLGLQYTGGGPAGEPSTTLSGGLVAAKKFDIGLGGKKKVPAWLFIHPEASYDFGRGGAEAKVTGGVGFTFKRRPDLGPSMTLPASSPAVREIHRDAGRPLSPAQRGVMEPFFGRDLGGIRLHTGEAAHKWSSRFGAEAFSVGRDIYIPRSRFEKKPEGYGLLAHELTHAIPKVALVKPAPAARVETKKKELGRADAMETRALRNERRLISMMRAKPDKAPPPLKLPKPAMKQVWIQRLPIDRNISVMQQSGEPPSVHESVQAPPTGESLDQLVFQIYHKIKKEIEIERERQGGF
jgi:hypothetical protein